MLVWALFRQDLVETRYFASKINYEKKDARYRVSTNKVDARYRVSTNKVDARCLVSTIQLQ